MSPDLRLATVYVMPLGGKDLKPVLAALESHKKYIRGEVAHAVNLKFAPDIRFLRRRDLRRSATASSGCWRVHERCAGISSKTTSIRSRSMARRKKGRAINGWLVLDKPVGMTSTQAVGAVRRLFDAQKAGHAGTLDPLATGVLPIALGEATKTVPYAVDGEKPYRFTVRWGAEHRHRRRRGQDHRDAASCAPSREAIEALLPRFTGEIMQTPPAFSAIKVDGNRAYDLARAGEDVELEARPVQIDRLAPRRHAGRATPPCSRPRCGKGTYVRALARDMGRALGCLGHVIALRRTRVGPFDEAEAVSLAALEGRRGAGRGRAARACCVPSRPRCRTSPCVSVGQNDAARLLRGQAVLIRGRDAPDRHGPDLCHLQGPADRGGRDREGRVAPDCACSISADAG